MPKQVQAKIKRNTSQLSKRRAERKTKSVEDEQDIRDARRALQEVRKKGSVSWEQLKREAGI